MQRVDTWRFARKHNFGAGSIRRKRSVNHVFVARRCRIAVDLSLVRVGNCRRSSCAPRFQRMRRSSVGVARLTFDCS